MRSALILFTISFLLAESALAQSVPLPASRPLEAAARRAVAPISTSPHPTFDHGTHQRIQAAMLSYASIEVRGGWPALPANARLAPGTGSTEVALLRRRLALSDDLAPERIDGELYDETVADAVRRFQARHGLEVTGSVGPRTLAALNVPVQRRIRQLAATLDRMAELQFTFGQRYVVVNIPAAVAEAVDGDTVARRHIAVVGKVDRPSPTLTTTIGAINLNPTWTVPLSIVKKDIVTKMRRDPRYVTRMRMRLLDGNGGEIDPKAVDWRSDRSPNFTIRQDAGAGNALGALRIDMPNAHAVYMHDTNTQKLFSEDYRFHSSGCARIADVRGFAAWLLEDTPGWNRKRIDTAIATGQTSTVRLAHRVPVAWVYFTGWVTRDDAVHFRDDVYGHDELPTRPAVAQMRPPIQTAARASGFVLQSAETTPVPRVIEQVSYLDSR
ncbi:MAG: murein L,D-transpeptidase [Alphaproteobacteria bacterium]|nr:murein L,D-transpeptidase [Alphaproteobacteria bacterium]